MERNYTPGNWVPGMPAKTMRMMKEIERTTSTKKALEMIVDLIKNYHSCEEKVKVPVEYDRKTGKPAKFEWKMQYENFEPEIKLYEDEEDGLVSTAAGNLPKLAKEVIKKIKKKGSIIADTKFGRYSFDYHKQFVSSDVEQGSVYPAHRTGIDIHFVSITPLEETE